MPECVNFIFVEWEFYKFFQNIRVANYIPLANPKNSTKEHLLMTFLLDLFILNTSLRRVDLTGGVYLFLMLLHQVGNQLIFPQHLTTEAAHTLFTTLLLIDVLPTSQGLITGDAVVISYLYSGKISWNVLEPD